MGKNNAKFIDEAELKAIKEKSAAGIGQKRLAGEYKVSPTTISFAIRAKGVAEFKKLLAERSSKEVAERNQRKATDKHNDKVKTVAAEKIKDSAKVYTPAQTKQLIDGLVEHTTNLEERVQTLVSLLITADDNVVSRVYNLEGKRSLVRRFLDRF